MDKQTVMKKVGKFMGALLGIAAILAILVLIAKMQDNAGNKPSGTAPEITAADHMTGKLDSSVTLLEYTDFQCPACGQYAPIVERLMDEYGDKVRFVYRHYPIYSKHPNAEIAGRAAEAAGKQGKFFEYGALLFEKQNEWSTLTDPREKFLEYATSLGLSAEEFTSYMNSAESKKTVTADYRGGMKAGVDATPTFFINGVAIDSPAGYTPFKKLLEDALAAAAPTDASATIPTTETASQ